MSDVTDDPGQCSLAGCTDQRAPGAAYCCWAHERRSARRTGADTASLTAVID